MDKGYIRWFDHIGADEIGQVGGKGLSLGRMSVSSLPVPNGFVLCTGAYEAFILHNSIDIRIRELTAGQDEDDFVQLEVICDELQSLFLKGDMPHGMLTDIRTAYTQLTGDTEANVAVRSSATAEDLAEASFAGQHDSFLNVKGLEGLTDAVRRCWASLWSARAISYRWRTGIDRDSVRMAVVVQRMVPADVSGIIFTANPLNGDRGVMVINSSWGLGEAIVEGQVDPDTVVVDKQTGHITQFDVGDKSVKTVARGDGTVNLDAETPLRAQASLDRTLVAELVRLAGQIEDLFGAHMDIEWGIHDGRVFILQARPITALPAQPLKWEAPGAGLWIHGGGIMEFQSEPISPMTSSLIEDFFTPLYGEMAPFIRTAASWPAVRVINGHLYSCLTYRVRPWHIPLVVRLVAQHLTSPSRWAAELAAYDAEVGRIASIDLPSLTAEGVVGGLSNALRAFFRYYFQYASMVQVLTNAESRFTRFYTRSIRSKDDPEAAFFLQGLESRITAAEDSIRVLADEVRETSTLAAVSGDAAHGDVREALRATVEGRAFLQRVHDYVETYGYQMYAFDFNVPTLGERLDVVYGAIRSAAARQQSLRSRRQEVRGQQDLTLERIRARLPRRKWRRFERFLDKARRDLQTKENAVFAIGRGIPVARACFLEMGRRLAERSVLADADSVFWLTWHELLALASNLDEGVPVEPLVEVVTDRRKRWERFENVDAPTFLPVGRRPGWWLSRIMPIPELDVQEDPDELEGAPVGPGIVTATARVIASIDDVTRLQKGEILVTDTTTPAWTPFFGQIAGLVTNRGGRLAHSSIVAREYGIPVVMGTVVATRRIADGQRITVDGDRGRVRLVPSA
ncbi:MAG: hypothetical protein JW846_08115 [Dehalococcoidia bacterium]|nr:hypothetical protein [Dehalococcoidia bacterium]